MKDDLAAELEEARERTWHLVGGLSDADLAAAACDYLSPPVWDLGHIANFEELWLVQKLLDVGELRPGFNDTYDAFRHPRPERPSLRLLDRKGVAAYMAEERRRTLEVLDATALDARRLTQDGFVHRMIILHEHQHQETLLQTIQMRGERYEPPAIRKAPRPAEPRPGWVDVPTGTLRMGRQAGPGVYDNESPPHDVDVGAFQMQRYPVTCGEYLAFIEAGGYDDATLWSERGQAWLAETSHHAPLYWRHDGRRWLRRDPRGERAVLDVANEVLCHVAYFEAEAFARFRDARLPTEAEWERAARGAGDRLNPWGDAPATPAVANVDQLGFGTTGIGSYTEGASPWGIEQLIGDVWEWCSDGFEAYPGFDAYPYDEYSKVFFGGDYRMLRGGAWATRPTVAHGAFRNWDHPYRRQIFSGIRLVR